MNETESEGDATGRSKSDVQVDDFTQQASYRELLGVKPAFNRKKSVPKDQTSGQTTFAKQLAQPVSDEIYNTSPDMGIELPNGQALQSNSFHPQLRIDDERVFDTEEALQFGSSEGSPSNANFLRAESEDGFAFQATMNPTFVKNNSAQEQRDKNSRHNQGEDGQVVFQNELNASALRTVQPKMKRMASEMAPEMKMLQMRQNTILNRSNISVRTNSGRSLKLIKMYENINSKWFDAQANEMVKKKYRKIASDQKTEILNTFGKQFPEIMTFITLEQSNNFLATLWSKVLMVTFFYNFFTCFWMLGFPQFPDGFWFFCEAATEIISMIDFCALLLFPRFFPSAWKIMFLLHTEDDSKFVTALRGIASLPTSLFLSGVFRTRPVVLKSFWVALTRLLKICRFRNFTDYFDPETVNKKNSVSWFISVLDIFIQFLMGLHFICIIWILPGRFEDKYGWFHAAGYFSYPNVPTWQIYEDAMVYAISNMSGMGFGNIVPLTNAEYFAACFIFTIGCSVYLKYYADFAVGVYSTNQKYMENYRLHEKCKKFAQVRHLPEGLRQKIRYFIKNLRIPFEEFKQRNKLVKDLPVSLKEEISLVINQNLIHRVKFFQFCSPEFIMKICRFLKPQICIINEHVFYKDSAAHRFYFINEGVCEVLASDEQTLIRFMSKGSFFGEIGCLLTGKRSCSVIVRTTTILHSIKKEPLIAILEEYPQQYKYLKGVGRQRLQTTKSEDIQQKEGREFLLIHAQINHLDDKHTVFGECHPNSDIQLTLPLLQAEFTQNMQHLDRYHTLNTEESGSQNKVVSSNESQITQPEHYKQINVLETSGEKTKPKFWQTKEFHPDYFLIIPWSPLFLIWNAILFIVVLYDTFMVMFSFCFQFEIKGKFMVVDILCICLLAVDIFMRANTAVTTPNKFCFDKEKVFNHYLNTWLLLDVVAIFPVCYFLMISPNIEYKYIALARLPRVLKLFRLNESINMLKWNSDIRIEAYRIFQLFFLYGLSGHIFGCGFVMIGRNDHRTNKRFDSQTLFGYTETRPQMAGIIDNMDDLTPWQMYRIMFYFGIGLCGACPYGDMIPMTPNELLFDLFAQIWVRFIWAFIIAECASFVGALHDTKALQIMKRDQIITWMKQNNVPNKVVDRYKDYEDCMFENFQGIEEQQILKSLPKSLRSEIRSFIFKGLIENWEAFPRESLGTLETVIRMLKLVVYPRNEYIITAGEIAEEMYFIVKGVVEIRDPNNEVLNTLKQGQNFGEMALLDDSNPLRSANAVSQTMVSLAVLTKEDFRKICEFFPAFHHKIILMVKLRKYMNERFQLELQKRLSLQPETKLEVNPVSSPEVNQGLEVIQEADSLNESVQSQTELKLSQLAVKRLKKPALPITGGQAAKIEFETSYEGVQQVEEGRPSNMTLNEEEKLATPMFPPIQRLTFANHQVEEITNLDRIHQIDPRDMLLWDNHHTIGDAPPTGLQGHRKPESFSIPYLPEKSETVQTLQTQRQTEQNSDPAGNLASPTDPAPLEINMHQDSESISSQKSHDFVEDQIDFTKSMAESLVKKHNQSMLRKQTIMQHFQQLNELTEQEATYDKSTVLMRVVQTVNMCLVFYNIVFIPLQFAFRIPFRGAYLALEILTILFYGSEIGLRIFTLLKLRKLKSTQITLIRNLQDRKLAADQDSLEEKIEMQIFEIAITSTALFPLSWIISETGHYNPFGWLLILQSLRLIKIRPVMAFWRWVKSFELNLMTLFQVIFFYYWAVHYLSCITIGIAIHEEDHRNTWLRRIPSPQPTGIRPTKNIFDDLSPLLVYNYAQYFQVNTLSNLTVGDVSPVTFTEKFLAGFNVWIGSFIYNLLFGFIAQVVAYLVTGRHIEHFSNYHDILGKIQNGKVSENVINSVRGFFDYVWYRHRGVSFDHLRQTLPVSISSDVSLAIFQQAIERSLIFCSETGEIDIPLAISVFKQMEFKQFLSSDYIVKVGKLTDETYILLEGQLRVYGLNDNELLGVLTQGSHFGLDLSDEFKERDQIFDYDERVRTEFKMDFASDNFDNRSIVNLVSSSIVTVGVLKQKDRDLIYKAFPDFKRRMQFMNRVLFQLGKVSLEKHTKTNQFQNTKYYCKNMQLNNIMFTTQEQYREIIDKNLDSPSNQVDLSLFIKKALLHKPSETKSIVNFEAFRSRVLKSDLDLSCNFDSLGNQVKRGKTWFEVQRDSTFTKVMKIVQFINLLYISFMIPFAVSFDYPMNASAITIEVVSLCIQFLFVASKLRTQVFVQGQPTFRLYYVLENYRNEGLMIDLFGLLPLYLILGIVFPQAQVKQMRFVWLISALRVLRAISIWRGFDLIDEFTVYLKSASYYIILIKAIVVWFIQGHLMVCAWYFLVNIVERHKTNTWIHLQKLSDKHYWEKYLRSYYFMLNIATGIGSGDMTPANESERFWISIFMTMGDVLWCFGFGLIFYFWGLNRKMNRKAEIQSKISALQELMESNEISVNSKQRMEKYFAYHFYQQQNSWLVDKNELMKHLPVSVVQEIVVKTNEQIFQVIFSNLRSENLIRELCLALESCIYLPEDLITNKGDVSNEVFFICDGTVHMLAADYHTIVMTLTTGQYFGEIGVLTGEKRPVCVQAATFVLLESLSKESIDQIANVYPQLRQLFEESANLKKQLIEELNVQLHENPIMEEQNRVMGRFLDNSFVSITEKSNSEVKTRQSQARQRRHSFNVFDHRFAVESSLSVQQERQPDSGKKNQVVGQAKAFRRRSLIYPNNSQIPLPRNQSIELSHKVSGDSRIPVDSKKSKPKKRLSDCSLGQNQMTGQPTGLKLQWNVQNQKPQSDWL